MPAAESVVPGVSVGGDLPRAREGDGGAVARETAQAGACENLGGAAGGGAAGACAAAATECNGEPDGGLLGPAVAGRSSVSEEGWAGWRDSPHHHSSPVHVECAAGDGVRNAAGR